MKALVDPFHEDSQGARVPVLLPRDTATFSTYNTYEIPSQADQLIISNFELGCTTQMVIYTPLPGFYNQTPIEVSAEMAGGEENYTIHHIPTG